MRWRVEWLSQDNTADLGLVAVALRNDWEVAVNPDDPPAGLDEYLARRRRAPSHYRSRHLALATHELTYSYDGHS